MALIGLPLLLTVAVTQRHAVGDWFVTEYSDVEMKEGLFLGPDGAPLTDTLQVRGNDIAIVGQNLLADSPLTRARPDLQGLLLELEVVDGTPHGHATLYADLRADLLPEAVRDREPGFGLWFAKWFTPRLRVADANFKKGQLQGRAALYAPREGTLSFGIWAEATFESNMLTGVGKVYYRETGQVRREFHFVDGVPGGTTRTFYKSGALASEEDSIGGRLEGVRRYYYENGAVREETTFEDGIPVGTATRYYPDKKKAEERLYKDGDVAEHRVWYSTGEPRLIRTADEHQTFPPHGTIHEYHPNGRLKSKRVYESGTENGAFEVFYKNGTRWEAGTVNQGVLTGSHKKWWKNGQLALDRTLESGLPVGTVKRWYANGTLWEEAHYKEGALHGRYRKWWKNGTLAHDYTYDNRRVEGPYRKWFDNGEKWEEAEYKDGQPVGVRKRYYTNGTLGYEQHYRDGRPHGAYKRWYENGSIKLEAHYESGQLHGDYKTFLTGGVEGKSLRYEHGRQVL